MSRKFRNEDGTFLFSVGKILRMTIIILLQISTLLDQNLSSRVELFCIFSNHHVSFGKDQKLSRSHIHKAAFSRTWNYEDILLYFIEVLGFVLLGLSSQVFVIFLFILTEFWNFKFQIPGPWKRSFKEIFRFSCIWRQRKCRFL